MKQLANAIVTNYKYIQHMEVVEALCYKPEGRGFEAR
jgi:hypothetical protein